MAQIKDEKQYKAMMARIDQLFFETDENTPDDDPRLQELDVLSALVEEYEKEHYAIEAPTLSETMNARNYQVNTHHRRLQFFTDLQRGGREMTFVWKDEVQNHLL